MSALQFFELFNEILIYRAEDDGAKSYILKDLMNYEGKFRSDLFEFLCWLISANGIVKYLHECFNILIPLYVLLNRPRSLFFWPVQYSL